MVATIGPLPRCFRGHVICFFLGTRSNFRPKPFPHLPLLHVTGFRYTDYVMPFMIQYLRNLHERVEAVDARTRVSVDKEEDAAAAATAAAAASMMDPGMVNGPALLANAPFNVPGQMGMGGSGGGGYIGDASMGGGMGGMGQMGGGMGQMGGGSMGQMGGMPGPGMMGPGGY